MIVKKCQVCDGLVVNGRCKLCGMPYRKDEELYHLNERRSDHYRHATPAARKVMDSMEQNASDRMKMTKTVSTANSVHKNITHNKTGSSGNSQYQQKNVGKKAEKKKKSWKYWLLLLLLLFLEFFFERR